MPLGKLPGMNLGWVNNNDHQDSIIYMQWFKKEKVKSLSDIEFAKHAETIKNAVRFYQTSYLNSCTATERRDALKKIKTASQRLINGNWGDTWLIRLLEALSCNVRTFEDADGNTHQVSDKGLYIQIDKLMRQKSSSRFCLTDLRLKLDKAFENEDEKLNENSKDAIRLLNSICSSIHVKAGKMRNPALIDLVSSVAPVWKIVTGRTLDYISIDKEGEKKHCYFADWLRKILFISNITPPAEGTTIDAVRYLKK